jgi:hypothetical protein
VPVAVLDTVADRFTQDQLQVDQRLVRDLVLSGPPSDLTAQYAQPAEIGGVGQPQRGPVGPVRRRR